MNSDEVERGSEPRRGTFVLAKPLVAAALGVWLVNDHVLKNAYGSWWTGKLTDVVALVVFPLLIATAIERLVRHPLHVAIGFTTIFYSAINLWPAADAATERLMSVVISSRLTMDPTDLLVLPAMAGAWLLWRQPATSPARLRRSWGRAIFVVGVATTIATSPDQAETETFQGTVLLTQEQPSATIQFSLSVDGEPAKDAVISRAVTYRSFATSPPAQVDLEPVTVDTRWIGLGAGAGDGELVITLAQPELAPLEVTWTLQASTQADGAGLFLNKSAPVPALAVDAPADQLGPEPLTTIGLSPATDGEAVGAWEWPVTVPADGEVSLLVSSISSPVFRASTTDAMFDVTPGFLAPVPRPESCVSGQNCSFSIWMSTAGYNPDDQVALYGPPGVVFGEVIEQELVVVSKDFSTPVTMYGEDMIHLGELTVPQPATAVDDLTTFVQVRGLRDVPNAAGDAQAWTFIESGTPNGSDPFPLSGCCDSLSVVVDIRPEDDEPNVAPTATGSVQVRVWSLAPLNPADIELTFLE